MILAIQRQFGTRPEGHDGLSLFDDAYHADRYLLLTDGLEHDDYTSYALVEERGPVMGYWAPKTGGQEERYRVVCVYLLRFFQAYLMGDPAGKEFLGLGPDVVAPGLGFTLEHRVAVPPAPTYPDFLNALLAGDVEAAITLARGIRDSDPGSPLLSERVLIRLGYHLIGKWEMYDEAITVFRLNTEIHPDSANAWDSLGEGYIFAGRREEAIPMFRKVLELDPGNERARRILGRLEEPGDPPADGAR